MRLPFQTASGLPIAALVMLAIKFSTPPLPVKGPEKETVGTIEKKLVTEGSDRFICRFPAHSFTLIEIGLEEQGR